MSKNKPKTQRPALYIRYLKKQDKNIKNLKESCSYIKEICLASKKDASYVFARFINDKERTLAYEMLKTRNDIAVEYPESDHPNLVEKRKRLNEANRKSKEHISNAIRRGEKCETNSNRLVIINLPADVSEEELKEQFPDAIDFRFSRKRSKSQQHLKVAYLTFESPEITKQYFIRKYTLHGTRLIVRFKVDESLKKKIQNVREKAPTRYKNKNDKFINSNKILVSRIPTCATISQLDDIFEHAIDIRFLNNPKKGRKTAIITLPTPKMAKNYLKEQIFFNRKKFKISICEYDLNDDDEMLEPGKNKVENKKKKKEKKKD